MNSNVSMVSKILIVNFFAVLGIVVVSFIGVSNEKVMNERIERVVFKNAEKVNVSHEIYIDILLLAKIEKNIILESTQEGRDKYKNNFFTIASKLEQKIYKLESLINNENKGEFQIFKAHYSNYIETFKIIVQMTEKDLDDEAFHLSKTKTKTQLDILNIDLQKVVYLNKTKMATAVEDLNILYEDSLSIMFWVIGVILIIIGYLILTIRQYLNRKFNLISEKIETIKSGNFSTIELNTFIEESQDELGEISNALTKSINLLIQNQIRQDKENWVKDSVVALMQMIQREQHINEIAKMAINTISRNINAGMGVLYLYHQEEQKVKYYAGYSYAKNFETIEEFDLGEGIVGQVAMDKRPIILENGKISGNKKIVGGTIQETPATIFAFPLIFKNELIGVIELASFSLIDEVQQKYLLSVSENLSAMIYSSNLAKKTQDLLETTQAQAQRLEESEQFLSQQNEELEEQKEKMVEQNQTLEILTSELEIQKEELENSKKVVEERMKEVEEANKYKTEFLANMSHELRTPLNSINILSKILTENKDGNLTLKQTEQASVIYQSGKDLLQLINDILDLSKIEARMMSLNIGEFTINSIFEELNGIFEIIGYEKNIEIKISADKDALDKIIYGDKAKVKQILKNFLSNAIKFTHHNGKIEMRCSLDTNPQTLIPIKISIIDNGIGIPKDKIDSIFEAFTQVDGSTSRKYGGTGLGLSISKHLAQLLQGKITVESKENQGSSFCLHLPLQIDSKEYDSQFIDLIETEDTLDVANDKTKKSKDDRDSISINDKTILIIEDDSIFAKIVKDKIHSLGLKVIIASSGEEGLKMAKEFNHVGILLDINLPSMNGWEVLKYLKSDSMTRHIPVKMISIDEFNLDAQRMGALRYITKPVEPNQLRASIEHFIMFNNKEQKDLLLVEDENNSNETIVELVSDIKNNIHITPVHNVISAIKKLQEIQFDCIVVDIGGKNLDFEDFFDQLRKNNFTTPIIAYSNEEISEEKLLRLRTYSDSLALKLAQDEASLVEETGLFLHRLHKNLTNRQKKVLSQNHKDLFKNKKVLLVDDDMRNIFTLNTLLDENGFDITTAMNGKIALEEIEKNSFDIVLMDIMMPVMDGYEAIEMIRKTHSKYELPIIALTGKTQKEDKEKCLSVGANDYMSKPVDNEQLLQLLKIWIRKI